jgi:tRNA pseudouridine55 synthase
VFDWTLLGRTGDDLRVRISCGPGTYIRALARDLGRYADSAAHLAELRRVRSGPFDISHAVTLDDIDAGAFALAPLRSAVPSMPARPLNPVERQRVIHGNAIDDADASLGPRVALLEADGSLLAVAQREDSLLRPRLVLADG